MWLLTMSSCSLLPEQSKGLCRRKPEDYGTKNLSPMEHERAHRSEEAFRINESKARVQEHKRGS